MSPYQNTTSATENDGLQVTMPQYPEPAKDYAGLESHSGSSQPSGNSPSAQKSEFMQGSKSTTGTICGLRRSTFVLSCLLALAVVAAILVGAVVGSTRSKHSTGPTAGNAHSTVLSSTTPVTPSTASSSALATMGGYVAPTDQTIAYPCEASKINSSTVTATYHAKATPSIYTYTSTCGEDCQGQDLFRIWAYSIDACVNACVNVNFAVGGNNCTAVALRADMGSPAIQNTLGANCFLKTACQTPVPQPDTMIMHATLNL